MTGIGNDCELEIKGNYTRNSASEICLNFANANAVAQVHYYENGSPWSRKVNSGPDANVPGWFYNLGVTGLRVELTADQPKTLLVRYVFPDSPIN
mgnify:CR=1 FL=1